MHSARAQRRDLGRGCSAAAVRGGAAMHSAPAQRRPAAGPPTHLAGPRGGAEAAASDEGRRGAGKEAPSPQHPSGRAAVTHFRAGAEAARLPVGRHEQRGRGLHGAEARVRPVLQPLVRREVPAGRGRRRRGGPLPPALPALPALRAGKAAGASERVQSAGQLRWRGGAWRRLWRAPRTVVGVRRGRPGAERLFLRHGASLAQSRGEAWQGQRSAAQRSLGGSRELPLPRLLRDAGPSSGHSGPCSVRVCASPFNWAEEPLPPFGGGGAGVWRRCP